MYAVGRLGSYISRGVYTVSGPFHPFGGAVDIIVVEQPDGSFRSSPWYVRFGKFQGVLKTREKVVSINVNGVDASFNMYLDHKGEAYFLKEVDEDGESNFYASSSGDESPQKAKRPMKSKSCNFDAKVSESVDLGEGKIVGRAGSRRSRILGLVFGRRSMKEESFRVEGEGLGPEVGRVDSLERAEIAADLLEVKWSTSLATKKYKKDNTSRFSKRDVSGNKVDDVCCNNDGGKMGEGIEPIENAETELLCLNSQEGVLEVEETSELIAETVRYEEYCLNEEVVDGAAKIATDNYNVEFEEGSVEEANLDFPGYEISWEASRVQRFRSADLCESSRSLHSGLSGSVEEHHETMLVQTEVVAEDLASFELENSYAESPEVVLLDSSEDGPNEVLDDMDNSFGGGDFLKPPSPPSSESSEEVQFQFSDFDDSRLVKNNSIDRHSMDTLNDERENSCLEICNQESSAFDSEDAVDKVKSSPISIARVSHAVGDEEFARLTESMPTMRSEIENLDPFLLNFPLSQSLDVDPKPLDISTLCKENESRAESEELLQQDQLNSKANEQVLEDAGNVLLSPDIELSLCKHMLQEGMGAEAAAKAFESEKLDREKFSSLCPTVINDDRLVVRINGRYFPWEAAAPIVLGLVSFGAKLVPEPKGMILVEKKEEDKSITRSPSSGSWRLWPFSFKRSGSRKAVQDIETETSQEEKEISRDIFENSDKIALEPKPVKKMVRSLTPTSEQLASLNLKEGSNSVTFTFSTAMLGNQRVDARIYLWKWNTRIIISDVDGTITRSDVLGQFMPLVGMDWSQTGVAHLFSAIKENGYQLLFLSARAISQAYITRQFLFNLKQDGKGLPDGPVVISPDGLFPSLYREVIRRAPHEFKIACLEEIKALFPPDCSPFYAGFGNRDTDEISYLKVGIPKGKIFTINPKGEVVVNRHINTKSYTSIHALVHGMFPPTAKSEQEDFNSWNFWKLPPPDIDI